MAVPITFTDGNILFASQLNSNFGTLDAAITGLSPTSLQDYSATLLQMQSAANPGDLGTESLPTTLAGELERLRFALSRVVGKTQWYEAPKYVLESVWPTGTVADTIRATAPTGWVLLDGGTLGDAISSATTYAADDAEDLFTLLWTDWANAQAAVVGGRGVSAAADWAAHKQITLPDARGRVTAGRDAAGARLTTAGGGVDGATLGAGGGTETHTLTTAQLAVHNHSLTDPGHAHAYGEAVLGGAPSGTAVRNSGTNSVATSSNFTGISIANAGSGSAHPNVQPTLVLNKMVKL